MRKETSETTNVDTKQLTTYISKTPSSQGLHLIRDFIETEREVCSKARDTAEVLKKNLNELRPAFRVLDGLIPVYEGLSINVFSEISLSNLEAIDDETYNWVAGLYKIIESPLFKKRAEFLEKAAIFYGHNQAQLLKFIDNNHNISKEDKQVIKDCFAGPALRITRMSSLSDEIEKILVKGCNSTFDKVKQLIEKSKHIEDDYKKIIKNNAPDSPIRASRILDLTKPVKKAIASKYPAFFEDEENQAISSLIASLENLSTVKAMTHELKQVSTKINASLASSTCDQKNQFITFILATNKESKSRLNKQAIVFELNKFLGNEQAPIAKLKLLEEAFETISNEAYQNSPRGFFNLKFFQRKDFPFTRNQLQTIHQLKLAYLDIVEETLNTKNNTELERYLEHQYPRDENSSQIGKLLAFNRTSFAMFIKSRTYSIVKLEQLRKVGMSDSRLSIASENSENNRRYTV